MEAHQITVLTSVSMHAKVQVIPQQQVSNEHDRIGHQQVHQQDQVNHQQMNPHDQMTMTHVQQPHLEQNNELVNQNEQFSYQQIGHQPININTIKTEKIKKETNDSPTKKKSKLDSTDKKPVKKKEAIDAQAREIIFKVIKFFESEKLNRVYTYPVENVVKRACAATGSSESTIKRIKRDGLQAEATQTRIMGPKKKRIRKSKVQLDHYQLCALRNIVNIFISRKEVPTLSKILTAARHELNYKGGKESLRLILLNKLGIKFKKCEKKNKKPVENNQPPIPAQPTQTSANQHLEYMKPIDNHYIYNSLPQMPPITY